MAIPFKSSIVLGQIFAQNDDFRILSDGNVAIEIDQREVKLGSGTQSLDLRHTMLSLNGVLGSAGQVISSSGTAAVCK